MLVETRVQPPHKSSHILKKFLAALTILIYIFTVPTVIEAAEEEKPKQSVNFKKKAQDIVDKGTMEFHKLWHFTKRFFNDAGKRAHRQYTKAMKSFQRSKLGKQLHDRSSNAVANLVEGANAVKILPVTGGQAVVYLTNGSAISCKIVSENDDGVVVEWQGGQVTFGRNEIARIERGRVIAKNSGVHVAEVVAVEKLWAYKNNPVPQMTNGQVLDSQLVVSEEGAISLREDIGDGAFIDQSLERRKIEFLKFKPIRNFESEQIETRLRKQFPGMRFYEDGMVTLITDTQGSSLKKIQRALDIAMTDFYLDYYQILKDREAQYQLHVVVFDKLIDWWTYGIGDGVPVMWGVVGYFSPIERVLFLHNDFGDEAIERLTEVVLARRAYYNRAGDALDARYGKRYEAQIEGLVDEAKRRDDNYIGYFSNILADQTIDTLRHELAHEFFNSWGVMGIVRSKIPKLPDDVVEKRRKMIEAKDIETKTELMKELLGKTQDRGESIMEDFKQDANNSWFSEGVAEYCSTHPMGNILKGRLFAVQEGLRKNELLPVEHLTVYKMGSFVGMTGESALSSYAQSWSLAHYLMQDHRPGFLRYLNRMADSKAEGYDDINWLLEEIGIELRELEEGWHAHIKSLPETEDPQIEVWMRVREIFGQN